MTNKEFIKILKKDYYSCKIEGDKIVVTYKWNVWLSSLRSLPPGVEFKNGGDVHLSSLTSLPPGGEFKNGGGVYLESLTSLPPGVEFKNKWSVYLKSIKSLPPGVEFNNEGFVDLESLVGEDGFEDWKGNIKGVDSKKLLNVMIKQGVFQR